MKTPKTWEEMTDAEKLAEFRSHVKYWRHQKKLARDEFQETQVRWRDARAALAELETEIAERG